MTRLKSVKSFLSRLPLLPEAYWTGQFMLGLRQPFTGRWQRLRQWLDVMNDLLPPTANPPRTSKIALIGSAPFWLDNFTLLGPALVLRGHTVQVLWNPSGYYSYSSNVSTRHDRWSAAVSTPPMHPLMKFVRLPAHGEMPLPAAVEQRVELSARFDLHYTLRRERLDLRQGEPRRRYLARVAVLRRYAQRMMHYVAAAKGEIDWAVIGNAQSSEEAIAASVLTALGIGYTSIEFHERRGYLVVAHNRPCIPYDFTPQWEADAPHVIDPQRRERVARRFQARRHPGMKGEYVWEGQCAPEASGEENRVKLGLNAEQTTVLLCTNIAWDSAVLGSGRTFPTMAEMIQQTVRWFAARPELQLIIRAHPAERIFYSEESTASVVAEVFPHLPPNLRLIEPGADINTYGLFGCIDLGIVFTSTVGLELACHGFPVVTTGLVHYAGKGFTRDPATPAEYFATLTALCGNGKIPRLDSRLTELAQCYFDVYFESACEPLPLLDHLNEEKPAAIRQWLLDCQREEYARTLDYLAGCRAAGSPV